MKVRIYNSAGELVYTLPTDLGSYHPLSGVEVHGGAFVPDAGGSVTYGLLGAGNGFTWDGRNSSGQFVAGGSYSVTFDQPSFSGPDLLYTAPATVLRASSQSSLDIYNSAGELVRHYNVPVGQASFLHMDPSFVPQPGSALKIDWGSAVGSGISWDGLDSRGQRVSSGTYLVKLTQTTAGAFSTLYSGTVIVLEAPSEPLQGLLAAPNPIRPGTGMISVRAPALGSGDALKAGLYNLAGELILQGAGLGPQLDMPLPPSLASGVYLLIVEAHTEQGVAGRRTLKVAVAR